MAAEQPDHIYARIGRSDTSASTGALAAHLARACGHVVLDASVVQRGYVFHAEISDEIPAFFLKRIRLGTSDVTVMLQGGIDLDGADEPFAGCTSTADVIRVLEQHGVRDRAHASLWRASIGMGARTVSMHDVADPLFVARHPNEFRAVAEELVAVGAAQTSGCPMCSERDDDDAQDGPQLWLVDDE